MSKEVTIAAELAVKREALRALLVGYGELIVAYSGGVDSAYLAWAAHEVLGDKMLAVIADSPSLGRRQMQEALAFANEHKIPVRVIAVHELDNPDYARNDAMRCFHCKNEMFTELDAISAKEGWRRVAYGVNLDDKADWRPGQQAAGKHDVAAPLLETGLSKAEVRALAQAAGLSVWNKPASACLASRIEYGRAVTAEALRQVEGAEDYLRSLGFQQFRVRHHGETARIEIAREELPKIFSLAQFDAITAALKQLGFKFVALDMEGFRSGSMNRLLRADEIGRAL